MSYRAIYDSKGLLAEFSAGELTYYREELAQSAPSIQVVPDIQPYQNMIDGKMITSRREHRELLKRHNCIEIGNEKMESKPVLPNPDERRKMLHKQLCDMSDRDANKLLKQLRRDYGH